MNKSDICNNEITEKLGPVLTAEQVAGYLRVDVRTIRKYHSKLGGIRLGRRILFFEKEVINALSKGINMGCPSQERRNEKGEDIPNEEGSSGVGSPAKKATRGQVERRDKHHLLA